jgi:hypothetical protein
VRVRSGKSIGSQPEPNALSTFTPAGHYPVAITTQRTTFSDEEIGYTEGAQVFNNQRQTKSDHNGIFLQRSTPAH